MPAVTDPNRIPQLLPDHLYRDHLAGLFDCRPDIVRLYASLCLARSVGGVTGWAHAAEALRLPAHLGVTTARAASAGLLTTTDRYVEALWAAAARLPDHDYRALEGAIIRRRCRTRWFTRWARAHRPRTRGSSRAYALTWLWVHLAYAHLDTSPVWPAGPTRAERAAYRRFADSLTDQQRQTLRTAWTARP